MPCTFINRNNTCYASLPNSQGFSQPLVVYIQVKDTQYFILTTAKILKVLFQENTCCSNIVSCQIEVFKSTPPIFIHLCLMWLISTIFSKNVLYFLCKQWVSYKNDSIWMTILEMHSKIPLTYCFLKESCSLLLQSTSWKKFINPWQVSGEMIVDIKPIGTANIYQKKFNIYLRLGL